MLVSDVKIEQLQSIREHIDGLSELLIEVLQDGASIGFLPPLKHSVATKYWESVLSPEVFYLLLK